MADQSTSLRAGALIAAGAGIILMWSAITGRKWSAVLKNLITGKNPQSAPVTNPITSALANAPQYGYGLAGSGSETIVGGPGQAFYTGPQLRSLWIMAGGSPATAVNAACHAEQESGGNPRALSNNPDGGINVGLWQLDTRGVGAGYTVAELMNPLLNARLTVRATNNGVNWADWSTPGC